MTTLASWAGVDSRGIASLYIVSDSRFTISGTEKVHTNAGQKVYVCKTEPHLFGFCGSVCFPSTVLPLVVRAIDTNQLFGQKEDLVTKEQKLLAQLDTYMSEMLRTPEGKHISSFNILHAARGNVGLKSQFRLWRISWNPFDSWKASDIPMPTHSKLLYDDGSGASALRIEHDAWQKSDVSKTSRAIFSAFCDALHTGRDKYSGGAPQLGGLFRKFAGHQFGVIFDHRPYYKGKLVDSIHRRELNGLTKPSNELIQLPECGYRKPSGSQGHGLHCRGQNIYLRARALLRTLACERGVK